MNVLVMNCSPVRNGATAEMIEIKEERISAEEYIEFLKRTDLGSQYPKKGYCSVSDC